MLDPFSIVTPNIEIIVSGLLPRQIHWSTRRVKINETNDYLRLLQKIKRKTFMIQYPDWALPDNSLNMELYYKDQLYLIENGNMKFSKLIIETLQDVLSPQSSQSSSYLSQSSLIGSPTPSSLARSKHPSTQNIKIFSIILRLLNENCKH